MCLTIPGKILEINEGKATVKSSRETAQIDLGLCFGAEVGDWILYATNRAVKVISEQDAKEIISLLEDNYRTVNTADLPKRFVNLLTKISKSKFLISNQSPKSKYQNKTESHSEPEFSGEESRSNVSLDPSALPQDDEAGGLRYQMTKEDIVYLLSLTDKDCLETLYAEANLLRKSRIDDFVCIHGIIEFSNYCKNNCLYCGIRKGQNIQRYRMSKDEIVETAVKAVEEEGYKLLVLQSGEDENYSDDELLNIVKEIKKKARVFVFLSVGERSAEFYKKAFMAGVTGSLMRFETSNPELYEKMRPEHQLIGRISSIRYQAKTGYHVASGSLIGLPGQSLEDIADDILTVKKLGVPMISSGPFLPASRTPLAQGVISTPQELRAEKSPVHAIGSLASLSPPTGGFGMARDDREKLMELTLKYIAISRFVMPDVKIPVTTALETLDPENGRHRALLAGANALMFNLTPEKYCGKYSIYDNKYREREKVWQKYGLFKGEESYEMLEERLMI